MKTYVLCIIFGYLCLQFYLNGKNIVSTAQDDSDYETPTDGKCVCGVFDTLTPTKNDCPIIKDSPTNVTCNDEGSEHCNKLCTFFANAARAYAPHILCDKIHHQFKLKVSVHSNTCETEDWSYTGVTSDEICCHDYDPIDCEELEE